MDFKHFVRRFRLSHFRFIPDVRVHLRQLASFSSSLWILSFSFSRMSPRMPLEHLPVSALRWFFFFLLSSTISRRRCRSSSSSSSSGRRRRRRGEINAIAERFRIDSAPQTFPIRTVRARVVPFVRLLHQRRVRFVVLPKSRRALRRAPRTHSRLLV